MQTGRKAQACAPRCFLGLCIQTEKPDSWAGHGAVWQGLLLGQAPTTGEQTSCFLCLPCFLALGKSHTDPEPQGFHLGNGNINLQKFLFV